MIPIGKRSGYENGVLYNFEEVIKKGDVGL